MNADTGEVNAVSETDRTTARRIAADSKRIVYSRGIIPDRRLRGIWIANGDGKSGSRLRRSDRHCTAAASRRCR